jgi:LPS-assembly lipoprotein
VAAIRTLLFLGLSLVLSGCGFQLREHADLPPEMAQTQMVINDQYSTLAQRVKTMLEQNGVRFVNADQATAILEIPENEVVTNVLTIGNNARVQEYRITHTVQFRLSDAQGNEILPMQILRQTSVIRFNEEKILAMSREQEYLKKDLAETLARLLVTRLESVSAGSG